MLWQILTVSRKFKREKNGVPEVRTTNSSVKVALRVVVLHPARLMITKLDKGQEIRRLDYLKITSSKIYPSKLWSVSKSQAACLENGSNVDVLRGFFRNRNDRWSSDDWLLKRKIYIKLEWLSYAIIGQKLNYWFTDVSGLCRFSSKYIVHALEMLEDMIFTACPDYYTNCQSTFEKARLKERRLFVRWTPYW